MQQNADYDNFAWLYNREWKAWIEVLAPGFLRLAGERLPEGGHVLDLCCGTGQFARFLTDRGYKVTGVDVSSEQLRYARKNAPAARFIKADARSFKFGEKYNAVFSTYDALNHIMALEELQETFRNVNRCLVKGGIFIFDLNTERAFETQWAKFNRTTDNPDYFYVVHGEYDKASRTAAFNCTIFQRKNKSWKRTDFRIPEKYYPARQVLSALKKAGFTDIQTFAADPQRGLYPPDKNTTRIFYRALKA